MIRLAILAALAATPAAAQQCGPRDGVVAMLASRFGEARVSAGLSAQGHLIETFASAETGSWTITVTHPDMRMCLLASGQSFEMAAPVAVPKGDPA